MHSRDQVESHEEAKLSKSASLVSSRRRIIASAQPSIIQSKKTSQKASEVPLESLKSFHAKLSERSQRSIQINQDLSFKTQKDEILPEISEKRQSQMNEGSNQSKIKQSSRVLQSSRQSKEASQKSIQQEIKSIHTKSIKSLQMIEQFQSEQIIKLASQTSRDGVKPLSSSLKSLKDFNQKVDRNEASLSRSQIDNHDLESILIKKKEFASSSQNSRKIEQNSKLNLELIHSEAQSMAVTSRNEAVKLTSNYVQGNSEKNGNYNSSQRQIPSKIPSRRSNAIFSQKSSIVPQIKFNAWESFDVSQFKSKAQDPSQVIEKLKSLTSTNIPFMDNLPRKNDIDSTDPLDSFMVAFIKIITDKSFDFNQEVKKGIHLATGIRTEFCEKMLMFICHHQKLEQTFRDSLSLFMESLISVVRLEDENKKMSGQIQNLLKMSEGDIVAKYELDREVKKLKLELERADQRENQLNAKIDQMIQQCADKKSECDSLQYRLQYYIDNKHLQGQQSFKMINQNGTVQGAVPNLSENEDRSNGTLKTINDLNSNQNQPNLQNSEQIDQSSIIFLLQQEKYKLEKDLETLKKSHDLQNQADRLRNLQELFNKIQIENKNIRIYNQKCEQKLKQKQSLIDNLEEKITNIIIEKEEIILKLKSDIVLQKSRLELNEENFQSKLQLQQQKTELEFEKKYKDQIKEFEGQVQDLDKIVLDLRTRLNKLNQDHIQQSKEFQSYRSDKQEQEKVRNIQYQKLEEKFTNLQENDDQKIEILKLRIEELENQNEVIKKDNNILGLRQKYLKSQTETLVKQKVFLFETLKKGDEELTQSLIRMENAMLESNNNQEYLVPVKRCIRQAKEMVDLGKNSLQNISQILEFLKIEKLYKLLTNEEDLIQLEQNVQTTIIQEHVSETGVNQGSLIDQMSAQLQQMVKQNQEEKSKNLQHAHPASDTQKQHHAHPVVDTSKQQIVQKFLKQIGAVEESEIQQVQATQKISRQSNFQKYDQRQSSFSFLQNNRNQEQNDQSFNQIVQIYPFEILNIISKQLVEIMINLEICQQQDDVPIELQQILQVCSEKSNIQIEKDLQSNMFLQLKKLIESQMKGQKVFATQEQQDLLNIQVISQNQSQQQSQIKGLSIEENNQQVYTNEDKVLDSQFTQQNESLNENSQQKIIEQEQKFKIVFLNLEIEKLQNKLEQQKIQSKNLQLNLAGQVVSLEEKIDKINIEKDEKMKQLEQVHAEELQKTIQGVEQRETQLIILCNDLREEIRDLEVKLENSWSPAQKSETLKKMEQSTSGNMYKLMKDEYDKLFLKNCELLRNYQAAINEFVYLREDLRGSFTLAFEIDKLNSVTINMLTEQMLKYYLSRTFMIDKSKFRFIKFEDFNKAKRKFKKQQLLSIDKKEKDSQILKLIIEVVAEDQNKVSHLFKHVKSQIKDGTSLLYDYNPLYFGMNLGSSGFSTHNNLSEFLLIFKNGQEIQGIEYVISILRHKKRPLIFKIIALNLENREEFMLELSESDIYELVEGEQQILINFEPEELIRKISQNLNIIIRDQIKVLTCNQKIFFNEIWLQKMESGKNQQIHLQSIQQAHWKDIKNEEEQATPLLQSFILNSATRQKQLSTLVQKNQSPKKDILENMKKNIESQTDFEISDLYEGFENVYRGIQQVGNVTRMRLSILESMKSNTLLLSFDDMTSLKRIKFSIYKKNSNDQFVIHTECMKIADNHHVMICVELIQNQSMLVRIYDIKHCASVYYSLIRKQNGHYTMLNDQSKIDLIMKQEFRSFLYEISFLINQQEVEIFIKNYQYLFVNEFSGKSSLAKLEAEQKKQNELKKRELIISQITQKAALPRRKRAQVAYKQPQFQVRGFYKDKWSDLNKNIKKKYNVTSKISGTSSDFINVIDWRNILQGKGQLLYRYIDYIRFIYEKQECEAKQSCVSIYYKDQLIQMEVKFFNDLSKMSIASEITSFELFGDEDPLSIPFKERINILNKILEKFFIICDRGTYKMKVDNDAVPIQEFTKTKKVEIVSKGTKEKSTGDISHIQLSSKMREIQEEKENLINLQRAYNFQEIVDIEGESCTLQIIFIKRYREGKTEKSGGRSIKKQSIYGKKQNEILQIHIENYIDELDWEFVYVEIQDKDDENQQALFDKKRLAYYLSQDEYFNYQSILFNINPLFVNYLKNCLKVNKKSGEITIQNQMNLQKNIFDKYKLNFGGKYLQRQDLELTAEEKKLLKRNMIQNQELEFSEFLYDIKVYEIQVIENWSIISYQIEIFTMFDPNVIYIFNYPFQIQDQIQDPHTLIIDFINLIEHPFKKQEQTDLVNKNLSQVTGGSLGQNSKQLNTSSQNQSRELKKNKYDKENNTSNEDTVQDFFAENKKKQVQQDLFKKYIDNRIILIIQEQRFPRKMDMILIEPSSQLIWRSQIEPRIISQGISSMNLIDQSIIELFISVMLDENQNYYENQIKLFEYQPNKSFQNKLKKMNKAYQLQFQYNPNMIVQKVEHEFSLILESSNQALFVKDLVLLEDEIQINISKQNEAFKIVVCKPQKHDLFKEQEAEKQDEECQKQQSGALVFRIKPDKGDTQFCKIIKCKGLNYCMILAKTEGYYTDIKVILLAPEKIQTLFKFSFLNLEHFIGWRNLVQKINGKLSGEQINFTKNDASRSIVDALRRLYGSQHIEQGMKICENQLSFIKILNDDLYEEPTIFERMDDEKQTVHQARLLIQHNQNLQMRTMVLYRKTFFDDTYSKLIIMQIKIQLYNQEYEALKMDKKAQSFTVILSEPESGQEMQFITPFSDCLTDEEIENSDQIIQDIKVLKSLAKIVLDERIQLKNDYNVSESKEMQIYDNEQENERLDTFADEGKKIAMRGLNILNNYTIEINFQRDSIEQDVNQDLSNSKSASASNLNNESRKIQSDYVQFRENFHQSGEQQINSHLSNQNDSYADNNTHGNQDHAYSILQQEDIQTKT